MSSYLGASIAINETERALRSKLQILQREAVARMWDSRTIAAGETLLEEDRGALLHFSDAVDGSITLPNDLPQDWYCGMIQLGAGRPTIAPDLLSTVNALGGTARIVGQYGRIWIEVMSNPDGASASAVVSGDVG